MPRKHIHKPGTELRRNYPPENMERALEAVVVNNYSFSQAASTYNVPKTTLYEKYKGQHGDKLGRPPVLNVVEENWIAEAMITAASYNYPFEKHTLKKFVQNYLNKKGVVVQQFDDNQPGDEWMAHFLQRHPEISVRNSENMKRNQAQLTPEVINEYFLELAATLEDVDPSNILNYDETNLADDPGKAKVFIKKGSKHARRTIDHSKSSTSVMFAASGDGTLLPPYIVFKAQYLYPDWIEGGSEGARYNRSKNGWFDTNLFEDWFFTIALPYFRRKTGKKVLIGDNLASHITFAVIHCCVNNNISFVLLPKNSTFLCQPLDVGVYGPFKRIWRKILTEWKKKNKGSLPKTKFPQLLKKLLQEAAPTLPTNIRSAFRASGIIPLDPQAVLRKWVPRRNDGGENENGMIDSFTEIIQEATSVNTVPPLKRRRKIDTPAGRSVVLEDLRTNVALTSGSSVEVEKETGLESDENVDEDDKNNDENEDDEPIFEDEDDVPFKVPVSAMNQVIEDQYVIVEFDYNKEAKKPIKKLFVAKVLQVAKQFINVMCFRQYKLRKDAFILPVVDDTTHISLKQIKFILKSPTINRGIHIFDKPVFD